METIAVSPYKALHLLVMGMFILNLMTGACHKKPMEADNMGKSETDTIRFAPAIPAGTINTPLIKEASGMVSSTQNESLLWTHNDSGDGPVLYLIDNKASYKLRCTITNAKNRDWEDIAIHNNKIYIADIGDNNAVHPHYTIYIADEPNTSTTTSDISITSTERIVYTYPDGPRDAETMLIDPLNRDIYIVSKREANVHVYKIGFPYNTKDTIIAEKVLTMPYTYFVGGDISGDGKGILMKTYQKIYYWSRRSGKTIAEALSQTPQEIPYQPEPQGESICWSKDGASFFTLSEESPLKIPPVLYRYDKK